MWPAIFYLRARVCLPSPVCQIQNTGLWLRFLWQLTSKKKKKFWLQVQRKSPAPAAAPSLRISLSLLVSNKDVPQLPLFIVRYEPTRCPGPRFVSAPPPLCSSLRSSDPNFYEPRVTRQFQRWRQQTQHNTGRARARARGRSSAAVTDTWVFIKRLL